jgi:hypothetical protein
MKALLLSLLHLIAILAGGFFFSFFFTYESQEGRIQSRLEDLWIRVDDLQKAALSWHLSFVRVCAGALTSLGDKLFGPKLISVQAIGVSMCFAFVVWSVGLLLVDLVEWSRFNVGESNLSDIIIYTFLGVIPFIVNKTFPKTCGQPLHLNGERLTAYRCSNAPIPGEIAGGWSDQLYQRLREIGMVCLCAPFWIKIWSLVLVFLLYQVFICPCIEPALGLSGPLSQMILWVSLLNVSSAVVGTGLFIIFVFFTRLALKKVANATSTLKAGLWLLLGCLPLIIYYLLFYGWWLSTDYLLTPELARDDRITVGEVFVVLSIIILIITVFINFAFIAATVVFLLVALLLLAHRVSWPIVERLTYKLQRMELAHRAKLFGFLGLYLMLWGSGQTKLLAKGWELVERLFIH